MAILKLTHIVFIFLWIGSLLTLTRLLAYAAKEPQEIQTRLVKLCRRLYFLVDLPSMLAVVALGVTLVVLKGVNMKAGWLHMKWTFAFFLIICDILTGRQLVKKEPFRKKGAAFKIFNGLAALFLIGALASIYILKH